MNLNTVCILLAKDATDEADRRVVRPDMAGKWVGRIGQYFTGLGYARRVQRGTEVVYVISWELSSSYPTKLAPGFPKETTNTTEPGKTTLGTLALHCFPDLNPPCAPGDDAKLAVTQKPQPAAAKKGGKR